MSQRVGGIVSYADDFVILCRSHRQARRSLEVITAWLTKVGLTIHPDKTRVCDAWEEPFDFLGYTFGVQRRFPTGTRFLAPVPSKKAQKRLKDRVKALLYRGNPTPWPELREELNRLIAGWANYFSFGWTGYADAAIHWHVAQQARRFLRKRHKLPRGSGRFSRVEVYGPGVGILEIWRIGNVPARVRLLVKPVREPDAGEPHVRFDERRRETEHGQETEALATERASNCWA